MSDVPRKKSRKSKLVPRDCSEIEENDYMCVQIEQPRFCIKSEESPLLENEMCQEAPIQFSVKVEVEELEDEHNADWNTAQVENEKKKETWNEKYFKQYMVKDEELEEEIEEIWRKTTNEADKKLTVEMRNFFGKELEPEPEDRYESLLSEALEKWKSWYLQVPYRDVPLYYKCYICDKAWWHLMPFRDHLKQHKELNIHIDIESTFRECCVALFDTKEKPQFKDIFVDSKCWRCGKDFEVHRRSNRLDELFYVCTLCKSKYSTCTALLQHEGTCSKYKVAMQDPKSFSLEFMKKMQIQFTCTYCDVNFLKKERLEEHMILRHTVRSDLPSAETIRICKACKGKYTIYSLHICQKKVGSVPCNYCCRRFQNKYLATLHAEMSKNHVNCSVCNKYIERQCMEMEHLVQHSDDYLLMYKCLMCIWTVVFPNDYSAKKHRSIVHTKNCKSCFEMVLMPRRYILEKCRSLTERNIHDMITGEDPLNEPEDNDATLLYKIRAKSKDSTDFIIENEGVQIKQEKEDDGYEQTEIQQLTEVNHDDLEIKKEYEEYEKTLSKVFQASKNLYTFTTTSDTENSIIEEQITIKEEPLDEEIYENDLIVLNTFSSADKVEIKTELEEPQETSRDEPQEKSIKRNSFSIDDLEPDDILKAGYRKRKVYTCTKCYFQGYHREYRQHIDRDCKFTPVKLRNREPVRVYQKGSFKCTKCNLRFINMKRYLCHFENHNLKPFTCPQCRCVFENDMTIISHVNSHIKSSYVKLRLIENIKDSSESKKMYKCRNCQETVKYIDFFVHWEKHLKIQSVVKSEPGTSEMTNVNEVTKVPDTALDPEVVQNIISSLLLTTIQRKRNGIRTKECTLCCRMFDRQNDCKRHLIEHLLVDAYANKCKYSFLKCQICSETFNKGDHYKQHMRDHAALPVFKCSLCDKTFSDSSNFTKHKKIHNIQVLVCDICKKKFQAKFTLEKHMEMHMVTPPIKCDRCDRIFYSNSAHRKHIKNIHEKGSPLKYTCLICRIKFPSLKCKWDHMWDAHKERKEEADCPHCDKSYRKFQDVKRHMKLAHNIYVYNMKMFKVQKLYNKAKDDIEKLLTENNGITFVEQSEQETLVVYE